MKIDVINGLRGYAILAVVYHHLVSGFTGPGFGAIQVGSLKLLPFAPLANGWLGVNLFFILSGFVLFLPYARGARIMGAPADVWGFLRRRGRRLVPLYYLCTLVGMLVFWSKWHEDADQIIRNALLMLSATFNFTVDMWMPKYNFVLWSLGIEIWFSLVFPILIVLHRRIGPARLFIFTAVLALATRAMAMDPYIIQYDNIYLNPVKDSFIARLDDFVLGMVLATVFVRSENRPARLSATTGGVAVGLLAIYATSMVWDYISLGLAPRWLIPLTNNLFQFGVAFLILGLLQMNANALRRFFDNGPLQLIGMMCYSLYVWHVLLLGSIVGGQYTLERVLAFGIALAAVSAFTYRYVEFFYIRDARKLFRPLWASHAASVGKAVNASE